MEVELVEIPKPATDEMVTLIHSVITSSLGQAADQFQFSYGDVMSACLHIIVENGLEGVTAEKLREDMMVAFDITLADFLKRRGTMQ